MFSSYTITKDGKVIYASSCFKTSRSLTYTIGGCATSCDGQFPYSLTNEGFTTLSYSSNGNSTASYITKVKDNGPNQCPRIVCTQQGLPAITIGGYKRCNGYTVSAYEIYSSNGKKTVYSEQLSVKNDGYNITCTATYIETSPEENGVYGQVYTSQADEFTIKKSQTVTDVLTTSKSKYSFTSIKYTNSKFITDTYEVYKTVNKVLYNQATEIEIPTFQTVSTIAGYRNKNEIESPSLALNFVNTAYTIYDLDAYCWYLTDKNFNDKNTTYNITQKFKSVSKLSEQFTISYVEPKTIKGLLGSYNSDSVDTEFQNSSLSIDYKTIKIKEISTKETTAYVGNIVSAVPFQTEKSNISYNTTTQTRTLTTNEIWMWTSARTITEEAYGTSIDNINLIPPLNFQESYQVLMGSKINVSDYRYLHSTFGEWSSESADTKLIVKDAAEYQILLYQIYASIKNFAYEKVFNPAYIDGQVALSNLTKFNKNAILEGDKKFTLEDQSYYSSKTFISVLSNIRLPVNFINKTQVDSNSNTIDFSPMNIAKVTYTTRDTNRTTVTSSTEYKWQGIGVNNPNTYFVISNAFINIGAIDVSEVHSSIYNINYFYRNFAGIGGYNKSSNFNIGRFRNDGETTSPISRLLNRGYYYKINNEGLGTFKNNSPQLYNATNDDNRTMYIPDNPCIIGFTCSNFDGNCYVGGYGYTLNFVSQKNLSFNNLMGILGFKDIVGPEANQFINGINNVF
jgi:hypothetical protein